MLQPQWRSIACFRFGRENVPEQKIIGTLGTGTPDLSDCMDRDPNQQISRKPFADIQNLEACRRKMDPMRACGEGDIGSAVNEDPASRTLCCRQDSAR